MLIAYDYSGSTGGSAFYHATTQQIVKEFPDASVMLWDNTAHTSTMKQLAAINEKREGNGGTYPHVIAEFCAKTGYTGPLLIISDGQVSASEVDRVDAFCETWKPSRVICHLIHTSTEPNMSISCPFTRTCPFEVYLHRSNSGTVTQQLMSRVTEADLEAFALLDSIKSVSDFEAVYPALEKVVTARTMGKTGDGGLRDQLLALRKRLIAAAATAAGAAGPAVDLAESLAVHDWTAASAAMHRLIDDYYGMDDSVDPSTWSGKVSRLVAMCEGALRSAFGPAALSTQLQRAATTTTKPMPTLTDDQVDAPDGVFVCPVSHEEERDVAIMCNMPAQPFLADQEKAVVDDLINCPLNLLRYPVLVERFVSLFGEARGLPALQGTGLPAFTLGACAEHVAFTNSVMAAAVTGGKLAGNSDLWFAVAWLLVRRGKVPTLAAAAPAMDTHMNWRLKHSLTFASLSGLPEFVTTRLPLGAAAWYVFAASTADLPAAREPLRAHMMHIDALRELVDFAGYELPAGVDQHVMRLRVLLHMLSSVKKAPGRLQAAILALHQNAYRMTTETVRSVVSETESWFDWIPLDGPATPEQIETALSTLPEFYRGLGPTELVGLAAMVDSSKSASDIPLAVNWSVGVDTGAHVVDWAYGLDPQPPSQTRISKETCRPLRFVDSVAWEDAAVAYYGVPVSKMMSTASRYALFVEKYGFYPTADELILYLYNRYVVHGAAQKRTLPAQTVQFVTEVVKMYEECRTLEPAEFVRRFNGSRNREERARCDGSGA